MLRVMQHIDGTLGPHIQGTLLLCKLVSTVKKENRMFLHRFRPQKTLSGYRDLLGTYLRPQWQRTVFMALLLLTSIGLQLFNPQLLRSFIDTALSGGSYRTLLLIGVLFVGISLVNQLVSVGATYLSEQVAWTATNWLRRDLVRHCLDLDMTFHQAYTPGALIERIDGDTDTLANFFSQTLVHLVGNLLLVLGIAVLFFQIDWRLRGRRRRVPRAGHEPSCWHQYVSPSPFGLPPGRKVPTSLGS